MINHKPFYPCHRRRGVGGFSLIEMLVACVVLATVLLLSVQCLLTAARVTTSIATGTSLKSKARYNLDVLTQDIQAADRVMDYYAAFIGGQTVYLNSNCTDTLVLRAPAFDLSGNLITTGSDYLVYQVKTPTNAADGPKQIVRTVIPVTGSTRAVSAGTRVLLKNVASTSFTYVAVQALTGDGTKKVFPLAGVPAVPVGSLSIKEVLVANADWSGVSVYSSTSITLTTAPPLPLAPLAALLPPGYTTPPNMDVRYSIDPTLPAVGSTAGSGNAANQILVTIKVQAGSDTALTNSANAAGPSSTLTTAADLRNRAAL